MEGSKVIAPSDIKMNSITKDGSKFYVACSPWSEYERQPETFAELSYDDGGIKVHFVSYETDIRAVETKHNTPVHKDSCMELFAQFSPHEDARYVNIEINPNGAAYCGIGTGREDSVTIDPCLIDMLDIRTEVYDDRWEIFYIISVEFIKKLIPSYKHGPDTVIRANLYKCGDETGHEHYGCFNPIEWQHPDFHRPEFFAEFKLV